MRRVIPCVVLAAVLVGCDSPATVVGTQIPVVPATPATPAPEGVSSIQIAGDTVGLIVGVPRSFEIQGYDVRGTHVSTDRAVITSSDPAIAMVSETRVIENRDVRTGQTWRELSLVIQFGAPGTVTLRATVDDRSVTYTLLVRSRPVITNALVVDSFIVVEFHVSCAWACPYLEYAPLLKLREPTGHSTVTVVSVEFVLGSLSTGVCSGSFVYTPGLSAHLNGIYDYLWSNDLIFVSLNGQPLPGDVAYAHVIVRQADGTYGLIEASGPVLRGVTNPVLPAPVHDNGWGCY
jgi:hypothetical protein